MPSKVVQANIEVHSRMADYYDSSEPHFRPENQQKVRRTLEAVRRRAPGGRLLDLGCGTGFMIRLAKDLFDEIHGVDVTKEMLARVDASGGKVVLHNLPAESLPFEAGSFAVVTGYSFLHHLEDFRPVLNEAYRVLAPGGLCYFDLDPNRGFWKAMLDLERSGIASLPDIVRREIQSVLHTDDKVEQEFGISKQVFQMAEPMKAFEGGLDPADFENAARAAGFSRCETRFEWFLGQGAVMHGQSPEAASIVEDFLRRILPLSQSLFKYLQFVLVK